MTTREIITKSGTTYAISFSYPGGRFRKTLRLQSMEAARALELELIEAGTQGGSEAIRRRLSVIPPLDRSVPPTLRAFSARYMDNYCAGSICEKFFANREIHLRCHLLPRFGDIRLDRFTTEMLDRYKADRNQDGLKKSTIQGHLDTLRNMLCVATDWGLISAGDRPKFRRPKRAKNLEVGDNFFFIEEERDLLAYLEHTDCLEDAEYYPIILFALRTGARQGELRGVRWKNVIRMPNGWFVRICEAAKERVAEFGTPKNDIERRVPLSPQLIKVLLDLRARVDPEPNDLVFPGSRPHCSICKTTLRVNFKRILKKVGIWKRVTWHGMRHTFATRALRKSGDLRAVQEMLGHADITTTQIYLNVYPESLAHVVCILDTYEDANSAEIVPWRVKDENL